MGRLTRQIPKGGTRGTQFREVARRRLDDAHALIGCHRYDGAIYLVGYAVECQLKYAYCERREQQYLPADLEIHDWDVLVEKSGVLAEIKAQPSIHALYSSLVELWQPALRYRCSTQHTRKATQLFAQFENLYQFLNEL